MHHTFKGIYTKFRGDNGRISNVLYENIYIEVIILISLSHQWGGTFHLYLFCPFAYKLNSKALWYRNKESCRKVLQFKPMAVTIMYDMTILVTITKLWFIHSYIGRCIFFIFVRKKIAGMLLQFVCVTWFKILIAKQWIWLVSCFSLSA